MLRPKPTDWVLPNLMIWGTTRAIVLDTLVKGRGRNPQGLDEAGFAARTELDRRDFGLTWNQALETGGVLVGNSVAIQLEIQAIRQA